MIDLTALRIVNTRAVLAQTPKGSAAWLDAAVEVLSYGMNCPECHLTLGEHSPGDSCPVWEAYKKERL